MSDIMDNYNDSMSGYAENITMMAQAVQGIYTSDSYLRMVQSARSLSEGLKGVYSNPDYIKTIQSAQKIAEAFKLSVPKIYYNPKTLGVMTKMAESISNSSLVSVGNKDLYETLQRNLGSQMKAFKQDDFIKLREKIRQSMPDIDALSSNLQRAAKVLQVVEYSDFDDIDDETIEEYSADIEKVLKGELSDDEIAEKNEKSEGKFAKFVHWLILLIITTFVGGYIEHLSEPIYELIDKVIVKEDIDDLSKEIGTPVKGTKITVWAKKDRYVEISYEDENSSVQGYISEDDFKNKSELVQDAVDGGKVVFISKCILSMSEYWNVDLDEANKRLNEEFDIIKEYIIPEYDRLVELTDEELISDIDVEYKKQQTKKIDNEFKNTSNYSDDELRFVIFCIESLAEDMQVDPIIVHDALTKESNIVDSYIIPCYETLHTQGKEYIIENLKEVMEERGVKL